MSIGADYYNKLKPVKYSVADSSLELDSVNFNTQQGNSLIEYNFLLSANDCIIKNYTSNYLTFNYSKDDIFETKTPEDLNNSIITQLYTTPIGGSYITLVPNNSLSSSQALLTSFNSNYIQNLVIDFDTISGVDVCSIWSYDKIYKKYLYIDESKNNSFIFLPLSTSYFNYFYDSENNCINLFYTLSTGAFVWLLSGSSSVSNLSVALPSTDSAIKTRLKFNTTPQPKRTSEQSEENFVLYLSSGEIDNVNSLQNIKNNFLMYSPYEMWVPGISSIEGELKFFNLKNYTSKNNFTNKIPFFKSRQQRNYNSIITNDYQETSNEKLQLGLNYYTKEYLIKPDKYTKFTLPSTIAPFERININDSGLKESGAYAAASPYFSDRVYKLLDNNVNVNNKNESSGIFLCSWLNIIDGKWYDRYYIPQYSSYIQALTSPTQQAFNYTTELSRFIQQRGLGSLNFYDINSSLMFEPNGTYYYARIGNKYIENVLSGTNSNLIKSNFSVYDASNGSIVEENKNLILNGNFYDKMNLGDITNGKFNVSFKLKTVDFENSKAYQLIGNNFNLGFALRKNFYFTPFVIIQEQNNLYFYDTDFNLITKNTYDTSAVGIIKDVCYVTQTDNIVLRTTTGLHNTDITGGITYSNTNINAGLTGSVIGRYFYSNGNRALFITQNAIPYPIFITDLQTLDTQPYSTATANSSSIIATSDGSVFELPGTKGINVNDKIGVSLSANKYVIFTDLNTSTSFIGISTTKIDDINCLNDQIYIQSNNKLRIFNTDRDLLSTINLSQSANTGFKIDFVNDDYKIYPIILSRDVNNKIIVDKISLSTGNILSTYNLNISAVSGSDFFTNPSGFHFTQSTYRNYENKLCLTVNLPNTFSTQLSTRIWDSYTRTLSTVSPIAYWAFNYSTITGLSDNSIIDIIPINDIYTHISIDFNLINGVIKLYINGILHNQINTPPNSPSIDALLKNIMYIGNQNYHTKAISDYVKNQNFLAKNLEISDLRVYDISLSEDFIKYLYMKGIKIDSINIDFSCDTRNTTETVDNLFSYNIPGRLSNRIKVYIKGINLTDGIKNELINILDDRIRGIAPANVSEITYDFNIQ